MQILLLPVLIVISGLSLKYFGAPWIIILASAGAYFVACAVTVTSTNLKAIFVNLAAITLALTAAEAYFYVESPRKADKVVVTDYPDNAAYSQSDEILGYSPVPGVTRKARKSNLEGLVYEATYTIGGDGLRHSTSSMVSSGQCLLFFGGSFTFGEGLDDDKTLASLLGAELGQGFRLFNFGFHGYGPHQMLAALEHGIVEDHVQDCDSRTAIYTGGYWHIKRILGDSPWDPYGPKYILESGTAVYRGRFNENMKNTSLAYRAISQLKKSFAYRKVANRKKHYGETDEDLFYTIIKKSRSLINDSDNSIDRFLILYWDSSPEDELRLKSRLSASDMNVIYASDILPNFSNNRDLYEISGDRHPSAAANKSISQSLVEIIRNDFM